MNFDTAQKLIDSFYTIRDIASITEKLNNYNSYTIEDITKLVNDYNYYTTKINKAIANDDKTLDSFLLIQELKRDRTHSLQNVRMSLIAETMQGQTL